MKFLNIFSALIFLLMLSNGGALSAQSIDVIHYDIHLGSFSFTNQTFQGKTKVTFKVLEPNLNSIELELYQLQADSILFAGQKADFNYTSPKITINFSVPLVKDEVHSVEVFYQGKPSQDPQGFGGFFFKNNIAFNIGVTMSIFPHNAGKMWFPCVDNFTDKATFDFLVIAPAKMTAVCGGELLSQEKDTLGNTLYHWHFTDPISTYLASVAVGEYAVVRDTFDGLNGKIPISIYVKPGNETFVTGSFKNLKQTISLFESMFGPYVWQRVGYVAVPFYAGAMEHATNIAYPDLTINGGLQYETLWAHELSHNWFGNLVTCAESGDMWLNEGFARYSEALFIEGNYNKEASKDYLRRLHAKTLKTAHYDDQGYYAVSGVPHSITYGRTVYDKGALVSHALRAYLGDTLFFSSLKKYFKDYKFGTATTQEFSNRISQISGINLSNFFTDWVLSPGFSQTELISHKFESVGDHYNINLTIRQKKLARDIFLSNQSIEVMILTVGGDTLIQKVTLNGETTNVTLQSPPEPLFVFLDPNEKYLDATVDQFVELKKADQDINLSDVLDVQFSTNNPNQDKCMVRVSKHFVTPSDKIIPGLKWSNNYWVFEPTPCTQSVNQLNLTFYYNGDTTSGFDRPWIEQEDSIVIFYREQPTDEWMYIKNAELTTGANKRDLKGEVFVFEGRFGQYTFASRNGYVVGRDNMSFSQAYFTLEPNPATEIVTLHMTNATENAEVIFYNHLGQIVQKNTFVPNANLMTISPDRLPKGIYNVQVLTVKGQSYTQKLIVR